MRKRDELSDLNSCMNKAHDDEWTFVLLGRDPAAPEAIMAWVRERVRIGKNKWSDPQITEALNWVRSVEADGHTDGSYDIPDNSRCMDGDGHISHDYFLVDGLMRCRKCGAESY